MTLTDLYIVGCGGHGREMVSIVDAVNSIDPRWRVAGFVDDHPSPENAAMTAALGFSVLDTVAELTTRRRPAAYVIGIADCDVRRRIDISLRHAGWEAVTLIHPDTTMGRDVRLGRGCVVFAGVRITTNVTVGEQVHINQNCTIGHDASLSDFVTVHPMSAISGGTRIDEGVLIGAGATVLQYVSVGRGSRVGAGALVVKDVPANTTVKGVPAR